MEAQAIIYNAKGERIVVNKTLKNRAAAEDWVWKMAGNERCVYAGCKTLAVGRLEWQTP